MVARITYGKNIVGVLEYNKLKVDKEAAGVLCCHKLPVVPLDEKIDFVRSPKHSHLTCPTRAPDCPTRYFTLRSILTRKTGCRMRGSSK